MTDYLSYTEQQTLNNHQEQNPTSDKRQRNQAETTNTITDVTVWVDANSES